MYNFQITEIKAVFSEFFKTNKLETLGNKKCYFPNDKRDKLNTEFLYAMLKIAICTFLHMQNLLFS